MIPDLGDIRVLMGRGRVATCPYRGGFEGGDMPVPRRIRAQGWQREVFVP